MKETNSEINRTVFKVLIVDDHPIVRKGLAQLINQESDFTVCADAEDIPLALSAIKKYRPDIIIVDLSLRHASGIRLIEDISLACSDVSILAFSMHDELIYAERCLKAGARGYMMKQEPPEKIVAALRTILKGDIYLSDKMGTRLLHKLVAKKTYTCDSPFERLSNRELEVFRLVGQGLKTRKIANELNLSVKTVETYIDHIKKKMNFDDTRNMFLHAVQWNMDEITALPARKS
jgi:DNA-binding NarL/FixJ family response regulator